MHTHTPQPPGSYRDEASAQREGGPSIVATQARGGRAPGPARGRASGPTGAASRPRFARTQPKTQTPNPKP
jgi:hypothetical protein